MGEGETADRAERLKLAKAELRRADRAVGAAYKAWNEANAKVQAIEAEEP